MPHFSVLAEADLFWHLYFSGII